MLHPGWLPLFAPLRDELLVDGDLGADDLSLGVIETERGIKEWVVLEGHPVNEEGELAKLTHFQIKTNGGFDAAILVFEGDRKKRRNFAEGNVPFVEGFLVEDDFYGLALGLVFGNEHVLSPFDKELPGVGSDQTSTLLGD